MFYLRNTGKHYAKEREKKTITLGLFPHLRRVISLSVFLCLFFASFIVHSFLYMKEFCIYTLDICSNSLMM